MSKLLKSIIVATVLCFIYLFPTIAHAACAENEIDVLGDGTQCETAKFTVTTTEIADGETFQFYMSAKGTFYVDCGAGGTLSGTGVSGTTITRSNTTGATYTCTYTGDTEAKTIRFGGEVATGNAYVNGTNANAAAIRFNVTPTLVAGISGSLGAIFPSRGTASAQQPRFYRTFYGCTNLAGTIPDNLFSGVTATATYMFYQTFYNCSKLTGYIPAGMFDKITTYSSNMMRDMFRNSGLDTTCSGTTVQYITGFESYWNGKVSCTEPFMTPVVLDDQSATTTSAPTTAYLKYRTGWYADADATTPISALTTNPTKTDYNFDGYWTAINGSGTQIIDTNGDFIATDAILRLAKITDPSKTIYANWTQDYTVTYDCGDGTGAPPPSATATSRKTFNIAANTCTHDGYMFVGWLVSGTSDVQSETFTWNYTENKTFTAQWVEPKFTLTTIDISTNMVFYFRLSASGTFYIDWGDGYGQTIIKTNTNETQYSHTYVDSGIKSIQFGGLATAYNTGNVSTIRFDDSAALITGMSGSLGAIFPTIESSQPRFMYTFRNCSKLTSTIPEQLFANVSGAPVSQMFWYTFAYSGISGSIPENLFSGISGAPAAQMFYFTFSSCKNLTGSIPENLFSGLSGAPATAMFANTFAYSGITGQIPENLFAGISGTPATEMFANTFANSGITGQIPENLFAGISGPLVSTGFYRTFENCYGLTGFIPKNLFAGITSVSGQFPMTNIFKGTDLYTSCPPCHTQYITGFESYWDGKVSCEVSLGENEHIYNDVCYQDCDAGITKIKTSTGLEFPIFDAKPTTPALAFLFNGKQCYAPLESGDGGTASMNVNVGGQIYHVGTNE